MGVFDAVNKGLGAVSDRTQKLISNALWSGMKARAGDVLDSRCGTVRWQPDDADHAFDIGNPQLPPTRVTLRLRDVHARIAAEDVELVIGRRAYRRVTFSASATLGSGRYLLRQTRRRQARFERDGEPLAVLARPRRATRSVDWGTSSVSEAEIALAHALAVYAGIGAPGAVANTIGNVTP